MFDLRSYRETCDALHAPAEKIEEVIAMTEHKKHTVRQPVRAALIAAAAIALMAVGVSAANPEGFQEFWYRFAQVTQVDPYRADITTEEGEKVTVMNVPHTHLENRDGRAILVMDGRDVADITEALEKEQHYVYGETTTGSKISLTVNGTLETWSIKTDVGTLTEDGSYNWFGGVTTTSEDWNTSLSAQIIDNGNALFNSVEASEGGLVAEVETTVCITDADDAPQP